ncbi:diamine N-acetyltransferase [Zhouia amylolytica]|nr:GNAT family N-acetyltransferase [Zhouia amylolytica]SFS56833.1 diamine N-acetyltransferase [Zhouia amylolytica]
MLKGNKVFLRALEPSDIDFLYKLENDTTVWEVSETLSPYSKFVLEEYLANAHRDIYEVKQLRLAINTLKKELIGFIDLFDFDPKNKRAGIGIIILNEANRGKGLGEEALRLLITYGFEHLGLHQVYCNIAESNKPSISLFKKLGFEEIGVKKDWKWTSRGYLNEILYQKIKK